MSKTASNNPYGSWKMILLLIMAGAVVLSLSPVSAEKPFVTIVAKGDQSYYMGEKVVFSGMNTGSDTTYLFITGPNLAEGGGKLASPNQNAVSGDPGSFTQVQTKPDKTWEYTWYTSDVRLDAGTYTIYAVTNPESKDQFNNLTTYGTVGIIYKKPFIATAISPKPVLTGQPFAVTGYAEGDPASVQLWILGNSFFSLITVPVDSEANYTFTADARFSKNLTAGDYYLIAQHSMADNQFDIVFNGEYVTAMEGKNSTKLFRVTGPGSLQGSDAAEALFSALNENEHRNETYYERDTYTMAVFTVDETGHAPKQTQPVTTAPVQQQALSSPSRFASSVITGLLSGMVV
ncbi:MAG: hypothetical protein LUQ66_11705 [Methanoregula sp.]|nr:hypothetical protein [Methanoregula sp.]